MAQIIILTGLIRSGKTTALKNWIESRSDVNGLLTPDINGKRYFLHYPDKRVIPMTAEKDSPDAIEIGRFCFSGNSFEIVNQLLIDDLVDPDKKCLLIDEVGPLELSGKGLFPALDFVLRNSSKQDKKIILVVRETLVDKVITNFKLGKVPVILKENLMDLH